MKKAEAEALVGQMVTTKETKWGGGGTPVIILGVGWESIGRSMYRGAKFRPCTEWSSTQNGVAVAEKWGETWHPNVYPCQQLQADSPEDIQARREEQRKASEAEWERKRSAYKRAVDLAAKFKELGFQSSMESHSRVTFQADDAQAILELLGEI